VPQPVKLSDALVDVARAAAEDADRSLASQIEHWARLGRSVEGVLTAAVAGRVKRAGKKLEREFPDADTREQLLQTLRLAMSASGHPHLSEALAQKHSTRYGTDPALPGCIVRVDAQGRRTIGRFVNRRFVPLDRATAADR
jgi:hypothetical protein